MTQALNVEYDELIARAVELEQPMPTPPSDNPQAPCALSFVVDAATQIALSADQMRVYLSACEREWRRLAQSLRNAAKAYEQVDEDAAGAVTNNTSVSAATAGSASSGGNEMVAFCDPDEDYVLPPPLAAPPPTQPVVPYYEVRQAATEIEAPDQGIAFSAFARDWDTYQRVLQSTINRFRPFTNWEGTSAQAVELNFEAYRTYVIQMAQLCSTLSAQAKTVATTHRWAASEHPTAYEVSEADKWYILYTTDPYYVGKPVTPEYIRRLYEWYDQMQKKSEEVLAGYVQRASLPLTPVNPKNPPTSMRIDPPPTPPKPDPGGDDGDGGGIDDGLPDDGLPDDGLPDDGLPDDGLPDDEVPDIPTTPTTPSTGTPTTPPTGIPGMSDSALKDALADLTAAPGAGVGAGMKPASVGGLGGGGGGSIPSMPMQPAVDAGSAAGAAGANAARDIGNLGRAGAGAGMGGGGMGMAPMAPGAGAGQGGDNKSKRAAGTEEALYSEERPWTEGVIGNRRRKDSTDGKDTK